jgi:hypothetical protein
MLRNAHAAHNNSVSDCMRGIRLMAYALHVLMLQSLSLLVLLSQKNQRLHATPAVHIGPYPPIGMHRHVHRQVTWPDCMMQSGGLFWGLHTGPKQPSSHGLSSQMRTAGQNRSSVYCILSWRGSVHWEAWHLRRSKLTVSLLLVIFESERARCMERGATCDGQQEHGKTIKGTSGARE